MKKAERRIGSFKFMRWNHRSSGFGISISLLLLHLHAFGWTWEIRRDPPETRRLRAEAQDREAWRRQVFEEMQDVIKKQRQG